MRIMDKNAIATSVKSYFDCIQAMNAEGWCELFAEAGVTYDPVGNPPTPAWEKAGEFFGLLSVAFESLEIELDRVFPAGNAAAVQWTMQVIGKNGRSGQAQGISTFEFDEAGKIQVVCAYWDDAALMAQIRG
jgi:steroid Delta-isomerase